MSEYPEDILKAANEIADKHYVDKDSVVRDIIAAAILAERKRCAKVCDDKGFYEFGEEIRKGGAA